MKRITLSFVALALTILTANAQFKKSWDFTKGLSDETIANLKADGSHWAENGNDADGSPMPEWKPLTVDAPWSMLWGDTVEIRTDGPDDLTDLLVETYRSVGRIEELMLRFFPAYLKDLGSGAYRLPQRTEQSLRNMLMMASARNYFFEMIPSMENPMGLGRRSIPMAAKVQNLLLEDFLGYLALVHGTYLSTWDEGLKKKPTGRP